MSTGGKDDSSNLGEGFALEVAFQGGGHMSVGMDDLEGVQVRKEGQAVGERGQY